jgi:hypothetical protein
MRARDLRPHVGSLTTAAACCVVAVTAAARTFQRALSIDPITPVLGASTLTPVRTVGRTPDTVDITPALDADPFRADRRRPLARYRLPGEPVPGRDTVVAVRSNVQLLGTVIGLDGASFAMCQSGNAPPRSLRVGQMIGDLTLKQIQQGGAMFVTPAGEQLELRVRKAGGP